MARDLARIPFIEDVPDDPMMVVDAINDRIAEVNRVLTEVESEFNQQKGNDGAEPIFNNEPNLRLHRITNGERSRDPRDFIIRQELIDLGLLGDASGAVVFSGDVTFQGQTTVTGPTGGSSGVVIGGELDDAINSAIGANVATSNAGEVLLNEQTDGTNGTTPGTAIMGQNENGKADFVQLRNGRIMFTAPNLESLLCVLIEEIRSLRNEL